MADPTNGQSVGGVVQIVTDNNAIIDPPVATMTMGGIVDDDLNNDAKVTTVILGRHTRRSDDRSQPMGLLNIFNNDTKGHPPDHDNNDVNAATPSTTLPGIAKSESNESDDINGGSIVGIPTSTPSSIATPVSLSRSSSDDNDGPTSTPPDIHVHVHGSHTESANDTTMVVVTHTFTHGDPINADTSAITSTPTVPTTKSITSTTTTTEPQLHGYRTLESEWSVEMTQITDAKTLEWFRRANSDSDDDDSDDVCVRLALRISLFVTNLFMMLKLV
jgi:hypothetical protein